MFARWAWLFEFLCVQVLRKKPVKVDKSAFINYNDNSQQSSALLALIVCSLQLPIHLDRRKHGRPTADASTTADASADNYEADGSYASAPPSCSSEGEANPIKKPLTIVDPKASPPKSLLSMDGLKEVLMLTQMDINLDDKPSKMSGCHCFDHDDGGYDDCYDRSDDDDDEGGLYGKYDDWEDYRDSIYN